MTYDSADSAETEQLLMKIRAGNRQTFDELFDRYRDTLRQAVAKVNRQMQQYPEALQYPKLHFFQDPELGNLWREAETVIGYFENRSFKTRHHLNLNPIFAGKMLVWGYLEGAFGQLMRRQSLDRMSACL